MYVDPNYPSKAALKRALAAGDPVHVFAPGLGTVPVNGVCYVEGPHYPKPHSWYAQVTMTDGVITKVK